MPNMTTPAPYYNRSLETPYFNWRNSSGDLHQLWFDSADSMKIKYDWAIEHGLKATGMWTSDATLHNSSLTSSMWAAVPDPHKVSPPPPAPKPGAKYSCFNASCSENRCFSTCVEDPNGSFEDINCEHQCVAVRPPPPPPPGPAPPAWLGPPPPPAMLPPGGTYFISVNMTCYKSGGMKASCGPGPTANQRDVQAHTSPWSLMLWKAGSALNGSMMEIDDDNAFVAAWDLEQIVLRPVDSSSHLLDFARVTETHTEFYRTKIVDGILRGRFAMVPGHATVAPPDHVFSHPVTGWNPAAIDTDIVPREWEVTLLCYGSFQLRLDRDASGAIVGRLKNSSTAGSSHCLFGQANCSSPEGIEMDVNVEHYDGESIAWSAVLWDPIKYPTVTRPYCGDGVTVCHFYATLPTKRGAAAYQASFVRGNVFPVEPHNGCQWNLRRRAILSPGFTGFDNAAARRSWQDITRRRLAHLMAGGFPAPAATPAVNQTPVTGRNASCDGASRDDDCTAHQPAFRVTELSMSNELPDPYKPGTTVRRLSHGYLTVPSGTSPATKRPAALVLNGLDGSAFDTLWPNSSNADGHIPGASPLARGSASFWYGDAFARRGFVVLALDVGHRINSSLYDGQRPFGSETHRPGITYPGFPPSGSFDWEEDGERAWDVSRAVDVLLHQPHVDPAQLVVTGLGMGAEVATTAAAFDERIRMVVPAGWCPDLSSDKSSATLGNPDGSQAWRWQNANVLDYIDVATLHALIAPRPLIVETGKQDMEHTFRPIAPFASAKQVLRRTRALYGEDAENVVHYMHEQGHVWQAGSETKVQVPVVTGPTRPGDNGWQTDGATRVLQPAGDLFALIRRMKSDEIGLKSPADAPLTAAQFADRLHRGVVGTWAEFEKAEVVYSSQWPQAIANVDGARHSFDHVRLRVSGGDDTMKATFERLDGPVGDSLSAGLQVVIAYKGWVNGTTESAVHKQVVEWWRATAAHYVTASHRLAFDVFIEIGGIMSNGKNVHKTGPRLSPLITLASDPAKLNALYKDVLDAIRLVSPTRVVAMPPGKLDRPWDLHQLQAPRSCGRYCMAEFHIIASGPCVVNCSASAGTFAWTGTNGTPGEREKIRAAIADAAAWRATARGLPVWTGAFMPGPYNHPEKGSMALNAQVAFASFYTDLLTQQKIGWSVLTAGDLLNQSHPRAEWIEAELPLRNALLKSDDTTFPVWPIPQQMTAAGPPLGLSPDFSFRILSEPLGVAPPGGGVLTRGVARYMALLAQKPPSADVQRRADQLTSCTVRAISASEELRGDTSVNHTLSVSPATCAIVADTVYGCLYAMESFVQLARGSQRTLVHSSIELSDWPSFEHRKE